MGLDSFDDVTKNSPGQAFRYQKQSVGSVTANTLISLWTQSGRPGAGLTPPTGVGEVPTSGTLGAIPFTNPVSPNELFLPKAFCVGSIAGTLLLYDRLVHTSGLAGNIGTTQTFNSVSVNRGSSDGTELWVECYSTVTGLNASTSTISLNYTNGQGIANRNAIATPFGATSFPARTVLQVPLQAGDMGLNNVQSAIIAVPGSAAGNLGISIVRVLQEISVSGSSSGTIMDVLSTMKPKIDNNACLGLAFLTSGTSTGLIQGTLNLISG